MLLAHVYQRCVLGNIVQQKNNNLYPDDYPAYRAAKKPFLDEIEEEARKWERDSAMKG